MTADQWKPFVKNAMLAGHDAFFETERYDDRGELLPVGRQDVWRAVAEAILTEVGPLIAEDTRERMVAAAARSLSESDVFVTHYEWKAPCTDIWHPCAGKDQLVRKLERFGGHGRMRLVGEWDAFPDIESAAP